MGVYSKNIDKTVRLPMAKKTKDGARMGPPSGCTKEMAHKVAALVKAGNWRTTAATLCDITNATYFRWMTNGKSEDPDLANYKYFRDAIIKAEAEFEEQFTSKIIEAAQKKADFENDPKHLMEWGKYRFRSHYGEAKKQKADEEKKATLSADIDIDTVVKFIKAMVNGKHS